MKNLIFLLASPALVVGVSLFLHAQEPERAKGRVLILQGERILEGDIEKRDGEYLIRRGSSEIVIAGKQVIRLCGDRQEAFESIKARANLADPDERLRLARWCHLNDFPAEAHAEAKQALEMRPTHVETKLLVKLVEHTLSSTQARAEKVAVDKAPPLPPTIDLSFETVTAFTSKVQPILMNTCVNCHSAGRGGTFQLARVYDGGQRLSTQRNLTAVLGQLTLDRPASSPLLIMAVSAHGNSSVPPIPGKQSPTYLAIVQWLDRTLADNPHLRERLAAHAGSGPRPASPAPVQQVAVEPTPIVSQPITRIEPNKLPASVAKTGAAVTPVRNETPMQVTPADPFDPVIFNQRPKN